MYLISSFLWWGLVFIVGVAIAAIKYGPGLYRDWVAKRNDSNPQWKQPLKPREKNEDS